MRQQDANQRPDAEVASIAARQHGVISSPQLHACGLDASGVQRRVKAGRLHRVHRGVYAVGHPNISNEGRWMAAVLACGAGAALSHRSAAGLWGMLPSPRPGRRIDSAELIHVTVASDSGRAARQGIRLHRSLTVSPADLTLRAGIPVTKPTRTLTDLRRVLPHKDFAAAVRQAEYLRRPLDNRVAPDRTRSELEARFLALCRRHRIP
jgi:hypothetical protein